jgi:hypothetical protein
MASNVFLIMGILRATPAFMNAIRLLATVIW